MFPVFPPHKKRGPPNEKKNKNFKTPSFFEKEGKYSLIFPKGWTPQPNPSLKKSKNQAKKKKPKHKFFPIKIPRTKKKWKKK